MAKHNRDTLKNYFREGALPTSAHFADLIDSNLNTLEEGFDKTAKDGFKIASLNKDDQLISFYRENVYSQSLWSVSYDEKIDSLLFNRNVRDENSGKVSREAVLTLGAEGNVGVKTTSPKQALDVEGVVRTQGRMGSLFAAGDADKTEALALDGVKKEIPADGNWHQITPLLEGCHALEVVAGVGVQWTGQYALLHAIAMNTCDPRSRFDWLYRFLPFLNRKNPIRAHHAYYRSGADKLQLKWVEDENPPPPVAGSRQIRRYYLAIKTNSPYKHKVNIRYHITRLWFDDYMKEGEVESDELVDTEEGLFAEVKIDGK